MDQRTEQERINNIHSGWEKFKELNPNTQISPELDRIIEERMWEANGIKSPLSQSEKVDAEVELLVNNFQRMQIKKTDEQLEAEQKINREKNIANDKKRKFRFYVGATTLILGISAAILFKDEIGGAIKDVVNTIVEYDNQKLDDEYEIIREQVFNDTGMTPEEIMDKGKGL